jgi:arginyl-tRNA--protein-N-Asp/Glu arginylyltransferase
MKQLWAPQHLSPEELDDYLSRGWFRIAQTLMTCRAIMTRYALRSTIWTRADLRGYTFKRSQRRLMRKVEDTFTVRVAPATLDATREALYQRYLTTPDGARAPSLLHFLFEDEPDRGLFNTWEVSIWDGPALVGFSWFDLGATSLQSLIAVYAPEVAAYSLGVYSLLREVQLGVETGRALFYAGYVLYGDPMMDYKLRTGRVSFMDDRDGSWHPWADFPHGLPGYIPPVERMQAALTQLQRDLADAQIPSQVMINPMFEVPLHAPSLRMCLTQPMALECFPERVSNHKLLVIWNIRRGEYALLSCVRVVAQSRLDTKLGLELLLIIEQLAINPTLPNLIKTLWSVSAT